MDSSNTDFTAKIAAGVITEVFKVCLNGFKKADSWFSNKKKKYDFFGAAARKYAKRMEERYNNVRIFGMNKPIELRKIYTQVNILEKITSRQRISVENLEKSFD